VFTAPVLITIFSYYFLREQISIWRWIAVSIGLVGMICVVQPFGSQIEIAYLWPFGAAIVYAGFIITTRFLGRKDSTESLAIYSIVAFLIISIAMGLIMGDGRFTGTNNPGLEFLLREWHWSLRDDLWPITMIGFLSAVIALAMSAAYRASEASFLAPFEYINLPLVLLWGYLVFGDLPNWLALLGISMIILGGMIMLSKDSGRTITRPL
jgi:drug/metabolite transporter (DMT)-like permease